MNISMVGIDHNKASIEYRELFSFTKAKAISAMQQIKQRLDVLGCVVISTCNRTEIWINTIDGASITPYEMLCDVLGVDMNLYMQYFTQRQGKIAVQHLFELSCGLKSQVWGEDQILTQVKEGAQLSRECECIDAVLETLFRTAVTAAKKVKTTVHLAPVDRSVATKAVELLKNRFVSLNKLPCMVIGNGEMGRLTANALIEQGCDVVMTLRQYKRGEVLIPAGCNIIHYDARIDHLNDVKVVISATSSPHYTLKYDEVSAKLDEEHRILIDLAVPRDIDPELKGLKNISLYDVDSLGGMAAIENAGNQINTVRSILDEYIADFEGWYYFKDLIPIINDISIQAAEDVKKRMSKSIKGLDIKDDEREKLCENISEATSKVVGSLMYRLRDNLNKDLWKECISGLEKSVKSE